MTNEEIQSVCDFTSSISSFSKLITPNNTLELPNILVKIRHGKEIIPARMTYNFKEDNGVIYMTQGDTGVAEGQFTVLYHDQECLGCARIRSLS